MDSTGELRLVTADEPGVAGRFRALLARTWPLYFLEAGPAERGLSGEYFLDTLLERWPELQFALEDASGELVAAGNWAPLPHSGRLDELPDEGWDWAITHAASSHDAGIEATHGCALAVTIAPEHQGKGLAYVALGAMRELARAHGASALYAPVRPNHKERDPRAAMSEYITRRRSDGHLADPWMRVHEKLGARVVRACDRSMSLGARPEDWERWCDVSLSHSGEYEVSRMLTTLSVDLEDDWAVYIEPNVWMVHPLT